MPYNEGIGTYKAGEALAARRRVKIESGTTNDPPEVVYADAGEDAVGVTEYDVADGDMVAVKYLNTPGTFEIECIIDSAIGRGTVLYAAADGKVSDTATGSAVGVSKVAAGADNEHIEVVAWSLKSTTAATVSVADAGGLIAAATVEAAFAEVFTHIQSAQKTVVVPLGQLTLEDGTVVTKFADGASATPGFSQESNKEVVLRWNNHASPTAVAFSVPLPQDLDPASNVVIHALALMSGSTDSPDLVTEAYFGAADTDCAGTDDEVDGGTSLTEYTCTLLATDVPTLPSVLTVVFGPKAGELGTDDLLLYAVWLEYSGVTLTA
jgi:Uncharacterized conserved protein (DUF2190)